ncbi:MAG: hypothetical protein KTR31_19490 [Myxococcales bacterium]|nr:hypothetical protein [Myxococcales bacterium]
MRTSNLVRATALLATGCIIQTPNPIVEDTFGTLDVSWQVGASGCDDAGITEVELAIGNERSTFPCNAGQGTFELASGIYEVAALGLDADGFARYEGSVDEVQVFDGQATSAPTIRLQARNATLDVTWRFDNGELCGPNGVDMIDIALFRDNRIEVSLLTECGDGVETLLDVPAGVYDVSLLANDPSGTALFSGDASVDLLEGDVGQADVTLTAL